MDRVVCIPVKVDILARLEMLQEHACYRGSGVGMILTVQVIDVTKNVQFTFGVVVVVLLGTHRVCSDTFWCRSSAWIGGG